MGTPVSTARPQPVAPEIVAPAVDRTSRHHPWRGLSAIVATVVALAAFVLWNMHSAPPSAQRACEQLSLPGLTTPEGRAIISRALADGVAWQDLHSRCANLVDDFARQSVGSSEP